MSNPASRVTELLPDDRRRLLEELLRQKAAKPRAKKVAPELKCGGCRFWRAKGSGGGRCYVQPAIFEREEVDPACGQYVQGEKPAAPPVPAPGKTRGKKAATEPKGGLRLCGRPSRYGRRGGPGAAPPARSGER